MRDFLTNRIARALLWRHTAVRIHSTAKVSIRTALRLPRSAKVTIGAMTECNAILLFDRPEAEITIGDRCFLGKSTIVSASRVSIGDDVMISWGVTITDHDSHSLDFTRRADDVVEWRHGRKNWEHVAIAPVTIHGKSWIGFGATILKGIVVGEGAVVAAQAVVTRDVVPWSIVGGNPAKLIRQQTAPEPASDERKNHG